MLNDYLDRGGPQLLVRAQANLEKLQKDIAAVEKDLAPYVTVGCAHAHGAATLDDDLSHLGIFNNANAAVTRALRQ